MAKFKIEDLCAEAKEVGWILISDVYQNLDTDLEYKCNNGHTISIPYKKIRKGFVCPICKEFNGSTEMEIAIKPSVKSKNTHRTLALDQSTKLTGYAIFDDNVLIKYGCLSIKGKEAVERVIKTREAVSKLIETWKPDRVVVEDIQLQTEEGEGTKGVLTYRILAGLLGVLEAFFFENKIQYSTANISTWRNCQQIKGKNRKERKANAQLRVKKCYDVDVTDDEADAILIGRYAIENSAEVSVLHW